MPAHGGDHGRPDFAFDAALDDQQLAHARDELRHGRWRSARRLLADTRGHWDRRTHVCRVLAQDGAEFRAVDDWLRRDPASTDAHVLVAYTAVARAFTDGANTGLRDDARRACLRVADTAADDPVPIVALLTLARLFATDVSRELRRWWQELLARDPGNREAHHQMLTHTFARCHGSHRAMHDFARSAARSAPDGSPLHVLPLAAHIEHYQSLRAEPRSAAAYGAGLHWTQESARAAVAQADQCWFGQRQHNHAQFLIDCNLLAFGLVRTGVVSHAAHVFDLIGSHATRSPWNCGGEDPAELFWHYRTTAITTTRRGRHDGTALTEPSSWRLV